VNYCRGSAARTLGLALSFLALARPGLSSQPAVPPELLLPFEGPPSGTTATYTDTVAYLQRLQRYLRDLHGYHAGTSSQDRPLPYMCRRTGFIREGRRRGWKAHEIPL
jgi:hypothetical protein